MVLKRNLVEVTIPALHFTLLSSIADDAKVFDNTEGTLAEVHPKKLPRRAPARIQGRL